MAERSQRKLADNSDFHPNDPFAELTRIMGFDPRVAEIGAGMAQPANTDSRGSDDDLGIDLERELMGEFEGDHQAGGQFARHEDEAPSDEARPVDAALGEEAPDAFFDMEGLEAELTSDLADAADAEQPYSAQAVQPAPVVQSGSYHAEPEPGHMSLPADTAAESGDDDFDFFDEELATSIEAELALDEVAVPAMTAIGETEDGAGGAFASRSEPEAASWAVEPRREQASDIAIAGPADDMADWVEPESGVEAPAIEAPAIEAPAEDIWDADLAFEDDEQPVGAHAPEADLPATDDDGLTELDDLALVDMDFLADAVEAEMAQGGDDTRQPAVPAFEPPAATWQAPVPAGYAAAPVTQQRDEPAEASFEDELMDLLAGVAGHRKLVDTLQPPEDAVAAGDDFEPFDDHDETVASFEDDADAEADASVAGDALAYAAPAVAAAAATMQPRFSLATPTLARQAVHQPAAPLASAPVATQAYEAPAYETPSMAGLTPVEPVEEPVAEVQTDRSGAAAIYDDSDVADIPNEAIAVADDLDLPQPTYPQADVAARSFEDLDFTFDELEMRAAEVAAQPSANPSAQFGDELDAAIDEFVADLDTEGDYGHQPAQQPPLGATYAGAAYAAGQYGARQDDFELQPDDDYAPDAYQGEYSEPERPNRKVIWIAGLVAGVAIVALAGAWSLSFGGGEGSGPTIVRADAEPVKVKPENPGGSQVHNQDNPVYDRVGGAAAPAQPAAQETLISRAEEPVDLTAATPAAAEDPNELPALEGEQPGDEMSDMAAADVADALPGVNLDGFARTDVSASAKNEDRITPAEADSGDADAQAVLAVAPRKVKTMIVRPDGTMVPREEELPAVTETAAATSAAEATQIAPATPAEAAAPAQPPQATLPVTPVAEGAEAIAAASAPRTSPVTPNSGPLAPARPGDQPVDIVGGVNRPTTAQPVAVQPQVSEPSGAWTMQIASQPTPEGAQAAYADLARRYSSVLQGKGVNIVKADIAGKGTFYRVRIPANSRNEAIQLCESMKAAGGSCFVSR